MKKIFLAAISIVCLMASCTKDEMQADPINPNEGKEVVFSSSIGEATRTLYAEENGNKIAVKWVDGDLISVYGSTCAVNQSDYTVKAATGTETTGGVSTNYYYAESLTKTGDVGVQWGSEATSDFYAVYPSVGDNKFTKVDGGVKVQTTVRPKQNVTFAYNSTTKTWVGQHYNGAASNPTMTDAVMYAYTAGATSGEQVDLKFKPFSTVLRFTFKGFKAIQSSGEIDTEYNTSTVAVNKIVLTAPNTKIAGDFALTINEDGTASATEGTSNTIEIYPDYLPMKNNEQLQFDIFTIPTANVMPQAADQAWKVQVVTEKGTFTFNMVPKTVTTPAEAPVAGLALTTGALHKLTIPLKTVTFDFDIPANNWIRYIPRNVYLSELSVPGAWYAHDLTTYHGSGVTLANMFESGVRAFHIDSRMSYPIGEYSWGSVPDPATNPYVLVCAGTEDVTSVNIILTSYLKIKSYTTVASKVKEIIDLFMAQEDYMKEYVVVVLTLAEKPKDKSGLVAGTIDPAQYLAAVNSMIDSFKTTVNEKNVPVLYDKAVTPETTVNDVLGRIILQVNVNDEDFASSSRGYTLPNTHIQFGSMAIEGYISGNITDLPTKYPRYYLDYQTTPVYWGATLSGLTSYYHQAQLTDETDSDDTDDYYPSLANRQLAIDNIVDIAYKDYSSQSHSGWYQLGIGGYTQTGASLNKVNHQDVVAKSLNAYLLNTWINPKLKGETKTINGVAVELKPSPVGIVLMNYCTNVDYSGSTLVSAILEMNTKFYLNRNHGADEWPDGNPFETSGDSGTGGGGTGGDEGQQPEL